MIITSSLSQGKNTAANGEYSHAEGNNVESKGKYSHAEGENTIAVGQGSHAAGFGTIAFADYQTSLGQYNKDKNTEDYFVIGTGTYNNRKDGFGVSKTKTYVSNSLVLPNLTKNSDLDILTYNTSTKEVYYGLLSELSIGRTDYATQALTASYSELAKEAQHASIASYSDHAKKTETSVSSSYSEQAKNATQSVSSSFAVNSGHAITASYVASTQHAITASYVASTQHAITASYVSSVSYAITASHIDDSSLVRTYKDVLVLKNVNQLPWFLEPGALALYDDKLYFCLGMLGWQEVALKGDIIPIPPSSA